MWLKHYQSYLLWVCPIWISAINGKLFFSQFLNWSFQFKYQAVQAKWAATAFINLPPFFCFGLSPVKNEKRYSLIQADRFNTWYSGVEYIKFIQKKEICRVLRFILLIKNKYSKITFSKFLHGKIIVIVETGVYGGFPFIVLNNLKYL